MVIKMNKFLKNKVFAFDLDGTLVNSKKELLPSSKKAIFELINNGAHIVLVSGRTYEGVLPIAQELELDKNGGFICSYNGGLIKNPTDGKIIFDKKFSYEETKEIHDFLSLNNISSITYKNKDIFTTDEINEYMLYEEKCLGVNVKKVPSLDLYIRDGVNKLLGTDKPEKINGIIGLLKNRFPYIEAYTSAEFFLEITPKGIMKSTSLKILLDSLNLTQNDLFAFGDGNNDISMLDFAHTSIVMENASEEVKKHGKYITHSCDEDGISYAINKIKEGIWR